jgi:hypothetical protein
MNCIYNALFELVHALELSLAIGGISPTVTYLLHCECKRFVGLGRMDIETTKRGNMPVDSDGKHPVAIRIPENIPHPCLPSSS